MLCHLNALPSRSEMRENLAFVRPQRLKQPMALKISHKQDELDWKPAELLAAVGLDKNKEAFVALFKHYAPRVKSYLLKNGVDNALAEEIVQNTFVSVWEKAAGYDPAKAAPSTWIFTIARNKRIDALRRDKFVDIDSDPRVLESIPSESTFAYADAQDASKLGAALDALPEDQAKLLRMAFFEDKSHQVIAKETRIPLGTVKSRLRLGLEKMRKLMTKGEAHD